MRCLRIRMCRRSSAVAKQRAGNVAASKAAYQQAIKEFTRALHNAGPEPYSTAELHSRLGFAYAGLGDAAHAISEGQKGISMRPTSSDPLEGPNREEEMAQIYALL